MLSQKPGFGDSKFLLLIVVIFWCIVVVGCSPVAKHKMLTFFFDGVPPLGGEPSALPEDDKAKQDAAFKSGKDSEREKTQHGPYAAQMCDGCHNKASGANRLVSFTLKEERRKLCLFCHEDKRAEVLMANFSWVHGPVQYGECLTCHNPHESPYKYMLKLWPVNKQCYFCHDENRLLRTETHIDIGDKDCIVCHNAHAQ